MDTIEENNTKTPAEMLAGMDLPGGWKVKEIIKKSRNATGGFFSQPYIVENKNGKKAFLKAIDYHHAFDKPDVAKEIQYIIESFNYERRILEICKDKKLSKVVKAIDDGSLRIDPENQFTVVQYIIFELADGDIRRHIID